MKQFISVLVAALFAAVSMTAIAQEKKAEKMDKMEKSEKMKMDKKDAPKKEQTAAQKKQQACNEQASERKLKGDERKKFVSSCVKPAAKKTDGMEKAAKKEEMKKQ